MVVVQVNRNKFVDLVTCKKRGFTLFKTPYWDKRFSCEDRGRIQTIRIQNGFERISPKMDCQVAIATVKDLYVIKILEIQNVGGVYGENKGKSKKAFDSIPKGL